MKNELLDLDFDKISNDFHISVLKNNNLDYEDFTGCLSSFLNIIFKRYYLKEDVLAFRDEVSNEINNFCNILMNYQMYL